ncbi:hypothetical protein F4823DRAFT_309789 [Ustulina deusta]|nr:hypothetical protein F4823DRAFT_309789 [Ustulina deusta]
MHAIHCRHCRHLRAVFTVPFLLIVNSLAKFLSTGVYVCARSGICVLSSVPVQTDRPPSLLLHCFPPVYLNTLG